MKVIFQSQLDLTVIQLCAGNPPKRRITECADRIRKLRRVGRVEHFPAKLQGEFFFETEGAEEAPIQVGLAGSEQDVAAAGSEADAGGRHESVRVEIALALSDVAVSLDVFLHLVGRLRVTDGVHRGPRRSHGKRPALREAENTVHLPPSGDARQNPAAQEAVIAAERQRLHEVRL